MSVHYHGNRFVYVSLLALGKGQNIAICSESASNFFFWETGTYSALVTSF